MKKILILLFVLATKLAQAQISDALYADANDFFQIYSSDNQIDYSLLKQKETAIKRLVKAVAESLPPTEDEELKFYCIAYNLHVIGQILEKYPIQSVKQIPNFFENPITIAGEVTTLNQTESRLLDKYKHGAIHFLLVCGAQSCPPYPNHNTITPTDKWLDAYLDTMLLQGRYVYIDPLKPNIVLSNIFNWYAEDFGGKNQIRDLIASVYLQNLDIHTLSFAPYDWALNDVNKAAGVRFIPTRLYTKGQVELKLFGNYYTQSEPATPLLNARSSFFSNLVSLLFGSNRNLNYGLFARVRSVNVNEANSYKNYFGGLHIRNQNKVTINGIENYRRFGLTAIGPQVRYRPKFIKSGDNIFVHTLTFPIGKSLEGDAERGYIDWNGISIFNQWFRQYEIDGQHNLFFDIGFNIENLQGKILKKTGGFALYSTPVTAIYSYFPRPKWTLYALGNVAPRITAQNYGSLSLAFDPFLQVGGGVKKFVSELIEVEFLITQFFGGSLQRNAQTINVGIRYAY